MFSGLKYSWLNDIPIQVQTSLYTTSETCGRDFRDNDYFFLSAHVFTTIDEGEIRTYCPYKPPSYAGFVN